MFQANVRIIAAKRDDRAAPELRAGKNIGFVNRAEAARAAFGAGVGEVGYALDFGRGIGFGVEGALDAFLVGGAALTEVHAARKFADDLEVELPKALGLERRDQSQRLENLNRAHVNEKAESLT